jgi:cytochrome P450
MNTAAQRSYWDTQDSEPYDFYADLRRKGPVQWDARMKCWLVTGYEEARFIMKNDEVFNHPYSWMVAGQTYKQIRSNNPRSTTFMQGETHRNFHRWWIRDLLGPAWVEKYRQTAVEPVIENAFAKLKGHKTVDLVDECIEQIPVGIFCALLDLPNQSPEGLRHVKNLNDRIGAFVEVANALRLEHGDDHGFDKIMSSAVGASEELTALLTPVVTDRRSGKGDDFISRVWAGGPEIFPDWNELDTLDACKRLLFAGVDTTTHAMANAYHILLTQPDVRRDVQGGDDQRSGQFAEEIFRLHGSIEFRIRRSMKDQMVGDTAVKTGDMMMVILAAADRDPGQFAMPDDAKMNRPMARTHLAFSTGPRACLGATLARAEVQSAIRVGLNTFPDLKLDPTAAPPMLSGFLMRSYRPLNVLLNG